jgi:hypothetical protein
MHHEKIVPDTGEAFFFVLIETIANWLLFIDFKMFAFL